LFDLDDTLFDHSGAARTALTRVHQSNADFSAQPFAAFSDAHALTLEELHVDVLSGARTIDQAREERFRRLFAAAGSRDDRARVVATAAAYREAYLAARRPVDGALDLLAALERVVRIGIVSNNLLEEQQAKVELCGFAPFIDALVVSEAVGIAKPDQAIFAYALEQLSCAPDRAVMVGDSWAADIAGARAAGIRAVWFNRTGRSIPEPATADETIAEIRAFHPIEDVVRVILTGSYASNQCASA
jgi:HAD superfamily hydrolase (TIGR01549 family)